MSHARFLFLKKSEKEKTNQCRTSNILATQFIELIFSGFNNFMNSFIRDFLMVLLYQFRFHFQVQVKSGQAAFFFFSFFPPRAKKQTNVPHTVKQSSRTV